MVARDWRGAVDRYFHVSERGSTLAGEVKVWQLLDMPPRRRLRSSALRPPAAPTSHGSLSRLPRAHHLQAGATTFLTASYIMLVNPQILSKAGGPPLQASTGAHLLLCPHLLPTLPATTRHPSSTHPHLLQACRSRPWLQVGLFAGWGLLAACLLSTRSRCPRVCLPVPPHPATGLSAMVASLICGLAANQPVSVSPGMGLNAFLVFSQVPEGRPS